MHKDFKTGLILGLVLGFAAIVWLATRPGLIKARLLRSYGAGARQQSPNETSFAPNSPDVSLTGTTGDFQTESPNVPDLTVYEQTEKIKTEKFHIVCKGETLSDIAYDRYGSAAKWRKIYNANRDVVKNPNSVRPGTKLIIPD